MFNKVNDFNAALRKSFIASLLSVSHFGKLEQKKVKLKAINQKFIKPEKTLGMSYTTGSELSLLGMLAYDGGILS